MCDYKRFSNIKCYYTEKEYIMEKLMDLDGNILLWIQENLRNDILTPVMKCLSRIADNGLIWIVIAVLLLIFSSTRKVGFTVGMSLLSNLLVMNLILKNLVARIRPYEAIEGLTRLVPAEKSFSFPSGHAGHAFAAAVVLYCMLPKKYGIPALVLAGLISVSRMYVGVHYPTDVLAGAVIGTGIALLCVTFMEKISAGKREKENKSTESNE